MSDHLPIKSVESGFTLIEVLIAIAIFSIGLMAMGALQSSSLMQTGDIGRKTEAWSILEEQAELIKSVPFYTNVATKSVSSELDSSNDHSLSKRDGRYDVHWRVIDNQPIGQVDVPGDVLLSGVPAGTYTVSKTIVVAVTRAGGDMDNDALARVEFVKTWAADGI